MRIFFGILGQLKISMPLISPNLHIEKYLRTYLESDDPDFAVMINGTWGCGKTYFLKNFCKSFSEEEQSKIVYISLNGVCDVSEIDLSIFQAVHPFLGSKGIRRTKSIFKSFLKLGLKIDVDADGDEKSDGNVTANLSSLNFEEFNKNAEGIKLIFDDLERCNVSIEVILAYINSFVEGSKNPVILEAIS